MSDWVRLIIVAVVLSGAYLLHYQDKKEAVDLAKSSLILESKVQKEKAEKELRAAQTEALKKKDNEIKNISIKLDSALSSLQQYKSCYELIGSSASSRKACPSRELSREDAEFLSREAARADEVVVERDFYYEQYEQSRRILEAR